MFVNLASDPLARAAKLGKVAFILSENIARRHLSKGQQAILVLRARLRDSRRGSQQATAAGLGISQDRMSAAQVILDWAAEQADEILSGSKKFDDVLSEARNRRAAASSADAQLKRLRRDAPDLAEDIKANGLLHPIVLDAEGVLIDGRNRLAACKLAGVEPTYTALNGHDPVAFILSANIQRRHLTEGQRAIATVRAIGPGNFQERRGAKREAAETAGADPSQISKALVILNEAPDLADQVMSTGKPFSKAYEEARARRDATSSLEAQIGMLRAEAPDLANLVAEERMTLREAVRRETRMGRDCRGV